MNFSSDFEFSQELSSSTERAPCERKYVLQESLPQYDTEEDLCSSEFNSDCLSRIATSPFKSYIVSQKQRQQHFSSYKRFRSSSRASFIADDDDDDDYDGDDNDEKEDFDNSLHSLADLGFHSLGHLCLKSDMVQNSKNTGHRLRRAGSMTNLSKRNDRHGVYEIIRTRNIGDTKAVDALLNKAQGRYNTEEKRQRSWTWHYYLETIPEEEKR